MLKVNVCPVCGKEFVDVYHPNKKYCGNECMHKARIKDLSGQKFGKLTVIKRVDFSKVSHTSRWLCKCECGNEKIVLGSSLKAEHTKSCGCERYNYKHGKHGTRLYNIYYNMLQRCNNPKNRWYKNYGARGILVCKEWQDDFMNFYNWAMQNNYADDLTLDRINVNGNYEPSNCRWATKITQQNNMRTNHLFTYNGETHTGSEWARKVGISSHFLYCRLRSHTFEDFIKDYI